MDEYNIMKTIKIKCLKDPQVIEMVYFEGIERFLIDLWESQGKTEWYKIMKEGE
jgi:hypothetical protein